MTPVQKLVSLALPAVQQFPLSERAALLESAASFFDGELAQCLRAEAVCHRAAEAHQMKCAELLQGGSK